MAKRKKTSRGQKTLVSKHTEAIIDAALALMDELEYESISHAYAEDIRDLAGKIQEAYGVER